MARYSAGWRTGGAGSTTVPVASIYGISGKGGRIREVSAFNTTTTACAIALRKFTSAGTPGTGQTELPHDDAAWMSAADCTCFDTHSAGPTITAGNLRVASLGAAIGSGIIWTFGDNGIVIPAGTANGIGIVVLTGTGQILDVDFTWDE